jgi:hypothetical protein
VRVDELLMLCKKAPDLPVYLIDIQTRVRTRVVRIGHWPRTLVLVPMPKGGGYSAASGAVLADAVDHALRESQPLSFQWRDEIAVAQTGHVTDVRVLAGFVAEASGRIELLTASIKRG